MKGTPKRNLKKDTYRLATVKLTDGTQLKFWTKLPKYLTQSAGDAWVTKTEELTTKSLIDFINLKAPNLAFTEEDFETYRQKIKDELN